MVRPDGRGESWIRPSLSTAHRARLGQFECVPCCRESAVGGGREHVRESGKSAVGKEFFVSPHTVAKYNDNGFRCQAINHAVDG